MLEVLPLEPLRQSSVIETVIGCESSLKFSTGSGSPCPQQSPELEVFVKLSSTDRSRRLRKKLQLYLVGGHGQGSANAWDLLWSVQSNESKLARIWGTGGTDRRDAVDSPVAP